MASLDGLPRDVLGNALLPLLSPRDAGHVLLTCRTLYGTQETRRNVWQDYARHRPCIVCGDQCNPSAAKNIHVQHVVHALFCARGARRAGLMDDERLIISLLPPRKMKAKQKQPLLLLLPFELVEHHLLPALEPNDLAALLATCKALHAYPVRRRWWAAKKRQWTADCWGCGRPAPLPADALFVRFGRDTEPCGSPKGQPCWFSHRAGDCWAFCSEACFWEHTYPHKQGDWEGGLEFDCTHREARAWGYDGYECCQARFALPAWPHPVHVGPPETLGGFFDHLPEIVEHHMLPHLEPLDVLRLLLAAGRAVWKERALWWQRYIRLHPAAECMQCHRRGDEPGHPLVALRLRTSLRCPECQEVQPWATQKGETLWIHTPCYVWNGRRNAAFVPEKRCLELQGYFCSTCDRPLDTTPYAYSIHPVTRVDVERLDLRPT